MRAGKVAGVQLILNNWFLVLIAIFSLLGLAGKALLVFSAVLWHELAHALIARVLGLKVREIELLPFGGVARIDGLNEVGGKIEGVVAAAGPVSSLALAALAAPGISSPDWGEWVKFYIEVNITLAVFNMLPALPLDGGRIVRALMAAFLSYSQATLLMAIITKIITAMMGLFILVQFLIGGTLHLSLMIAAVFLHVAAQSEIKVLKYRAMNVLVRKKAQLSSKGIMPAAYFVALKSASAKEVIDLFKPDHYGVVVIMNDQYRPCGSLTETEIWERLPDRGFNAKIGEFL